MSTTAVRPGTARTVAVPGTNFAVVLYCGDVDRDYTVYVERAGRTIGATVEQHADLAGARAAANNLYRSNKLHGKNR